MKNVFIEDGDVVLPYGIEKRSSVLIVSGKIAKVGRTLRAPSGFTAIKAKNFFVSPGFIDSHIHGNPGDILANEPRSGTTSIVLAVSCDRMDRLYEKISRAEQFAASSALGRSIIGVRLEGPYISRSYSGAQDARFIRKPDSGEVDALARRCGPLLKMITVAPEIKGAAKLIKALIRNGITPSMGHSDATYNEAVSAIAGGAKHVTHLFNGMRQMDRREGALTLAALLDDNVTVEVIADLIHVEKAVIKLLVKIKPIDNIILITDSVRWERNSRTQRSGKVYRLKDGTIAGGSIGMIEAVANVVKAGALDLAGAVRAASTNPARIFGVGKTKGIISAGMDADVTIFDKNFKVAATLIKGNIVYRKRGF